MCNRMAPSFWKGYTVVPSKSVKPSCLGDEETNEALREKLVRCNNSVGRTCVGSDWRSLLSVEAQKKATSHHTAHVGVTGQGR